MQPCAFETVSSAEANRTLHVGSEKGWEKMTKKAGREFVGIGVGAIVINSEGKVFVEQRGPLASDDQFLWGWPGGEVEFGETLEQAIKREYFEEFGMEILPFCQIAAFDNLNRHEQEHWVSVLFAGLHLAGDPKILEPGKCSSFGWYDIQNLPRPLSTLSDAQLTAFSTKFNTECSLVLKGIFDEIAYRFMTPSFPSSMRV